MSVTKDCKLPKLGSSIKPGHPSQNTGSYPSQMPPSWTIRTLTGYQSQRKRIGHCHWRPPPPEYSWSNPSGKPSHENMRGYTYRRTGVLFFPRLPHPHCQISSVESEAVWLPPFPSNSLKSLRKFVKTTYQGTPKMLTIAKKPTTK